MFIVIVKCIDELENTASYEIVNGANSNLKHLKFKKNLSKEPGWIGKLWMILNLLE